jgi:hypothetical protein
MNRSKSKNKFRSTSFIIKESFVDILLDDFYGVKSVYFNSGMVMDKVYPYAENLCEIIDEIISSKEFPHFDTKTNGWVLDTNQDEIINKRINDVNKKNIIIDHRLNIKGLLDSKYFKGICRYHYDIIDIIADCSSNKFHVSCVGDYSQMTKSLGEAIWEAFYDKSKFYSKEDD